MDPEIKKAQRLADRRDKLDADVDVIMMPFFREIKEEVVAMHVDGEMSAKLEKLRQDVLKWPRSTCRSEALTLINFYDREA